MDRLVEIEDELAEQVYWQVATLLDLEVDLLFFDTTSTYFELDQPDTAIDRDERGHPVAQDERPSPDTHPRATPAATPAARPRWGSVLMASPRIIDRICPRWWLGWR